MKKLLLIAALLIMNANAFANESYKEYMFKVRGTCQKWETMSFKYMLNWEASYLGVGRKDQHLFARIKLQLFEDGTYWAGYEEIETSKLPYTGGGILIDTSIGGHWFINDKNELELPGLGLGYITLVKVQDSSGKEIIANQLNIKIDRAINDQRLVGKKLEMDHVVGDTGPNGIGAHTYCGIK